MARDEARHHPRRRADSHYTHGSRPGETAWRAWLSTGVERRIIQPEPCRSCGHHAGDHKGYEGQLEARCTLDAECLGYRDWDRPALTLGLE